MTEESTIVMRASKSARIILALCELYNLTTSEATDIFYKSVTAEMINDGTSDLQCRSDKYLATLIWEEHLESPKSR